MFRLHFRLCIYVRLLSVGLNRASLTDCGKSTKTYCHSEQNEESLFLFAGPNPGEIPRSTRNDKMAEGLFPQPANGMYQFNVPILNAGYCATHLSMRDAYKLAR
jgi:hypothetical protein